MISQEEIKVLNDKFLKASAQEIVNYFVENFNGKIALASSLGIEDQVLTEMVVNADKNTQIFTLDTGRMFPESYDVISDTNEKYGIKIRIYFPENDNVEQMVNDKGINLFYDSVENRKECCGIRKIEPLKRAFSGLDVWICGLRREQSITRYATKAVEWDENNGLLKVNPLIEWTEQEVWDYIKEKNIPYNKLHDTGFPSIGCQPCTRAIKEGEDVRAGRWWWEAPESKECGLHKR